MSEWKDIQGYEDLYRVNTNGEVYSVRSNKILKPFYRGRRPDNKYFVVDLNKQSKRKTVSVHRLVAEAFIPNPNSLPCVNHKDGNKDNNCVDNLEWCTYSENNQHAYDKGLKYMPSGTKNKNSKLTYDDVVEIKKCLILGDSEFGTRPLAEKYGVDHKVIMDIYHNREYQDVEISYTYFVCSDIHSAYTEWMEALNKAGFNKNKYSHKVVVCGDLFDRMDETVQTYEFAKKMAEKNRLIYIRGNHEDLLFRCVDEIATGYLPGHHHFSNGTVKTICQFCGIDSQYQIYDLDDTARNKIYGIMQPILDFIRDNSVDYAEIGDFILVHGWIPLETDDINPYHARKTFNGIYKNWQSSVDITDAEFYKHKSYWEDARWINGMEAFRQGMTIPDKTIVCGHWHTSWAHSKLHNKGSEWDNDAIFTPFVDKGIVAIDGCVAHTRKINCIVLEVDDE